MPGAIENQFFPAVITQSLTNLSEAGHFNAGEILRHEGTFG
jgi:hypothetical protein